MADADPPLDPSDRPPAAAGTGGDRGVRSAAAREPLGVPVDEVVAWFEEVEADSPDGPAPVTSRPPSPRRSARSLHRANALVLALAVVAAVSGLLAGGHPTVCGGVDAVLRAAFAFVVAIAASRARRWAWLVLAGVPAIVALDLASAFPAWIGLAVAFAAAVFDIRNRVIGAVVGVLACTALLRLPDVGPHGSTALISLVAVVPVFVSAYRLQPRRTRARIRRAGYVVAVTIGVPSAALVLAVALGAPKVDAGIAEVTAGVDQAKAGDDEAAAAHLRKAVDELDAADAALNAWYTVPARLVPLVSYHAAALGEMAGTGHALAEAASDAAANANYRSIKVDDGRVDTGQLTALGPPLRQVQTALDDARSRTAAIDTTWLLTPLRAKYDELVAKVDDASSETATAIEAVDVVPAMLGADGPRRYFVAFVTPAELRGSGGYMGNWAELTADDGRLELTRSGRNVALRPQPGDAPRHVDAPPDYLARYGNLQVQDLVYDIPLSPDFPSVAQAYESVYSQTTGGGPVDGVISIDPYALAAMLRITGPIAVNGLDEQLDADNAADILLRRQYLDFDQSPERADFLAAASSQTFDAFIHQSSLRPSQLSDDLGPMIDQRRLMAASVHADEQRLIARLGLDGAFPDPGQNDFFALVTQNGGNNKVDAYLHRSVRYQATFDPSTGHVDATATVVLRNDAPSTGLPDAVILNRESSGQPRGTNWMWFNFYSPHPLVDATLDGGSFAVGAQREFGMYVYHGYLAVPSEGTATVVLRLSGSISPGADYRVDWFQQATVYPDRVQAGVEVADGWQVANADGAVVEGRSATVAGDSRVDGRLHATVVANDGDPR